jgi:hypothetical protein
MDAEQIVIRKCERCGEDRIRGFGTATLAPGTADYPVKIQGDVATCGCGTHPLDSKDREALAERGP